MGSQPTASVENGIAMWGQRLTSLLPLRYLSLLRRSNMTLAKKGKRKIVLDGIAFRWTVSPDDEPGVALVAELDANPASRVVVWFPHGILISPASVAVELRAALASGWNPEQRGPDLVRQALPGAHAPIRNSGDG